MEFLRHFFAPNSTSEQFRLNVRDFMKGLVVTAFAGPVTIIAQSLEAGHFNFDWPMIWKVALAAGFSYIMKNFFTPSK